MSKRLSTLNPRWVNISQWSDIKVGVTFDCPCPQCQANSGKQRLGVMIVPPIDPDNKMAEIAWAPAMAWNRTGDSFDNLSLTPSIDCSSTGHWHGVITNGDVR